MKRIIVATDFSEEFENALQYAIKCIDHLEYEIILFTLQNPSIHVVNARLSYDFTIASLESKNEKLRNMAESYSAKHNIAITPYFATGNFHE